MLEFMDRHVAADTMTELAGVHARHGCLRDAITCYERALDAMREHSNRALEARTRRDLDAVRGGAAAQEAAARSNARTAS